MTKTFTKSEFSQLALDNEIEAEAFFHEWKTFTIGGYLCAAKDSYRHYKERKRAARYARKRARQSK